MQGPRGAWWALWATPSGPPAPDPVAHVKCVCVWGGGATQWGGGGGGGAGGGGVPGVCVCVGGVGVGGVLVTSSQEVAG
jgi:hypothetical protein